MKDNAKVAKSNFKKIEDKANSGTISEKKYDKEYKIYSKCVVLEKYSKLLILEGIVL